jgi:hypothetical protein
MRRCALVLSLLLLTGCRFQSPLLRTQVAAIITDAMAGVSVGCGSGWLEPWVCDQTMRILQDALAATAAAEQGWQAAAKAVLMREEEWLSVDDKARPYLDAAIALL